MKVEAQVTVEASRTAVWSAIADIEHAASIVSGIQKIEILLRPPHGLAGLKWRETRMLFGKPASADKWITKVVENESYETRAEDGGFVFLTTKRITEADGMTTLSECHESLPRTLKARLMAVPMGLFFRGVIRKAVLQDLRDLKAAAEADDATARTRRAPP